MLIKYYSYLPNNNDGHGPVQPDLIIIEKAGNIVVHGGLYSHDDIGPEEQEVYASMFADCFDYILQDLPQKRLITFVKDGSLTRLSVFGTAYICNDNGETIEKVCPSR